MTALWDLPNPSRYTTSLKSAAAHKHFCAETVAQITSFPPSSSAIWRMLTVENTTVGDTDEPENGTPT